MIGLALVRRIRDGVVLRRLGGRAGTANHVASGNADGNVGVDRVLLGLGSRVGVLLGVRRLDHVLLLAVATAAGRAAGAAAGLRGVRGLIGLAVVRCIGIGTVVRRLGGRARTANHVISGDADGNVGVDCVLLGLSVGAGVLLRLGILRHVLLLAVAAAAGLAAGAAARLRGICRLIRLAVVVSGGVGGVRGRLIGRTGPAGHVPTRDADGDVGVDRVLLALGVGVGVLLRHSRLVDRLSLAGTTAAG